MIQLLTVVSKEHVLVFYSKISKWISFEKFNNFSLLNPLKSVVNKLHLYYFLGYCV